MQKNLIPRDTNAITSETLIELGQAANEVASANIFADYNQSRAISTIRNHRRALALFADFLGQAGDTFTADEFQHNPACWRGVTWGLIMSFKLWLVNTGYAIGSVNNYVASVKLYAGIAAQAEFIPVDEHLKIRGVGGYSRTEGLNLDEKRSQTRRDTITYALNGKQVTRSSTKKDAPTPISHKQANALKAQLHDVRKFPAAAWRNRLLMCLLLDHGLRASEVVRLTCESFDFETGEMRYYRPKVKQTATHKLMPTTWRALQAFEPHMPEHGPIFTGNYKDGRLRHNALNRVTVSRLVNRLGKLDGIFPLSAHDCRHFCATDMARRGYGVDRLCEWFGWTNAQTALNYIEGAKVAVRDLG